MTLPTGTTVSIRNPRGGDATRTGQVVASDRHEVLVRVTVEDGRRVVPFMSRVHRDWVEVAT